MQKQYGFTRSNWCWLLWIFGSIAIGVAVLLGLGMLMSSAHAADVDSAEAPWWVAAEVTSNRPKKVIVWYERDITERFGFFAFIWKESDRYEEVIIGPTWKPVEDVQVGCGIGRESMPEEGRSSRRSCFLDATWKKLNFYGAAENGRATGPWHRAKLTYALSERLGFGVMQETDLGRGPRLELNLPGKVQVWGARLRDQATGISSTTVGINVSF